MSIHLFPQPFTFAAVNALFQYLISTVLTLSIITAGFSPELFHDHEEHHAHCHDTHENESVDACHMAIYHNGVHLCKDHDHVTEEAELCELCLIHQASQWWNFESHANTKTSAWIQAVDFVDNIQGLFKTERIARFLRGPPLG